MRRPPCARRACTCSASPVAVRLPGAQPRGRPPCQAGERRDPSRTQRPRPSPRSGTHAALDRGALRGRFFYKVLRRHALCPPTAPRMSPGLSCRLRQGRLLGLLLQRWHRGPWFGDTAALRQGLVAQQRHPQRHPTPDATRSPTAAGSPGASALALGPTPSRRAVCWLGSARPRSRPPAGATTSPRPRLTTAAPPGREHACGGGATATPRVWCFESPGRSRRAAHTSRHHWPPAPEP